MLTFEEFQDTRTEYDVRDGARMLRIPEDYFENTLGLLVYEGDLLIEEVSGPRPYLVCVDRQFDEFDTLSGAERHLYDHAYLEDV